VYDAGINTDQHVGTGRDRPQIDDRPMSCEWASAVTLAPNELATM
jgi:hypothetical protein